jgi:lactaldehyde reductase
MTAEGDNYMANRISLNPVSYHGAGAIAEIVNEMKAHGFQKAFVASDPDLVKFGVTGKVTDLLTKAAIPFDVYSNIKPNPTIENVQSGVEAFKKSNADCIVAVGGGSSMDTSKAIGIIIANPEFADVRSLEGVAPTKNPCVPIIAVPTTAGTAAEVTINYVITDVEKERKFVCVDTHDMPIVAVVDPEMMSSMPKGLTAATGMDALTHAIEGYTTRAAWEMTDMFHLEAIKLISTYLRSAVANEKEGREGMALGQYIAGMGFSNVGLGIDHSMAHTLSAHYDTPHGVACASLLPISMEFNRDYTGEKYREIARAMGVEGVDSMSQEEYRDAAINAVKKLSADVNINPKNDRIREEDLDQLATDALNDACYPGNPREATKEQVIAMFRQLM